LKFEGRRGVLFMVMGAAMLINGGRKVEARVAKVGKGNVETREEMIKTIVVGRRRGAVEREEKKMIDGGQDQSGRELLDLNMISKDCNRVGEVGILIEDI
jgi:hypothetical protein